jgi:citrate synthase
MAALRTAVSALGLVDPDRGDNGPDATRRKAIRLIARVPAIVAACDRARRGEDPVPPRADLGHAASFLHQLRRRGSEDAPPGRMPDLHAEHGRRIDILGRVTAATLSTSSAVRPRSDAEVPLHGGQPGSDEDAAEIDARGINPPPRAGLGRRKVMGSAA